MKMALAGLGYVWLANAALLAQHNEVVIIYETNLKEPNFFNSRVINHLEQFKQEACVIVANRVTADLKDVCDKIYSRDLFGQD
jgi:hypothetical protein